MKVRDALLVLLSQQPAHGYQLKSDYERISAATINIGQVYQTLERLERDAFIRRLTSAADDRRVNYAVTEAGHAAALSTVREVVPLSETTRNDITLRVLLAIEVEAPHEAAIVIDTHRLALISQLQAARQHVRGHVLNLVERLALEADLVSIEAVLRWLDICDDELKGPR